MTKLSNIKKIRIVSPSGAVSSDYIDGAAQRLMNWGFEVEIGRYAKEVYGRFAGTEEQRIADLQDAINDKNIDAILCSRGGYGLVQIIDKIDFEPLHTNFKLLIGFSDISVLHARINNQDKPSLHASMARHLTELPDNSDTLLYLKNILSGQYPHYKLPDNEGNRYGEAEAYLVGGNLSVLMGLWGTPYELELYNAILFIEDIGEEAYKIDRMIQQLRLSGAFHHIKGLIIGQFTDCDEDERMKKNIQHIILDACEGYDFPIAVNFPAGHEDVNYPLILGKKVSFKVDKKGTSLDFNLPD